MDNIQYRSTTNGEFVADSLKAMPLMLK